MLLFFFFQAEDGIRDDLVTGVQTCALPISLAAREGDDSLAAGRPLLAVPGPLGRAGFMGCGRRERHGDRKSTRLNSSHQIISYAVFCLKKKNANVKSRSPPP